MSKIPKHGAVPLLYIVEESRGHAWRPLHSGCLDQREALAALDAHVSSYTRRVVQVVAVKFPAGTSEGEKARAYARTMRGESAAEYGPDRYAGEDFPRPCGVTP